MNVTIGINGRGDEKEYLQKSQVTIDTTHSMSILYFVSSIAGLPTDNQDCVECYRDPAHPVCSMTMRETEQNVDFLQSSKDLEKPNISINEPSSIVHVEKIRKPQNYQTTGKDFWIEPLPGSERAARPLLIASIRENDQNIRAVVKNYVEEELHSLTKPSFRKPFLLVSMPCGKVVSLSANINVSALDNKMTQTLTGRTGAFCTACKSTSNDTKDITKSSGWLLHGPWNQ